LIHFLKKFVFETTVKSEKNLIFVRNRLVYNVWQIF